MRKNVASVEEEKGGGKMEGERIRLVPVQAGMAGQIADYCQRNREFLGPFEPKREEDYYTEAGQEKILAEDIRAWQEMSAYRFYIVEKNEPSKIIGTVALSNVVRGAFLSAFLGYKLDAGYLNQGYMTEAVNMITEFAFTSLGLHRIEANVMPRNLPSLRVLEKCGFQNEGISPKYLKINGVWEDHVHMVRLNERMHDAPTAPIIPASSAK